MMEILIDYVDQTAQGRIVSSQNFSRVAWNRIRDLILGIQADALITGDEIIVDWTSILTMAPQLSDIREEYGFKTIYNDQAKHLLLRYRNEIRLIREVSGKFTVELSEKDINSKLEKLGFTRRKLTLEQIRDVSQMVRLSNGANFSVPGAGKTTVAFATHVLTRNEDSRLLVVAPKNAFSAWDEVVADCMDSEVAEQWKFARLTGGYEVIKQQLIEPPMRMIISYDQLTRVRDLIIRMLSTYKVHIILDESHRMKAGDRSQRGDTLLRLAHLPVRRDILSGTPIPCSIEDIFPQLDFLWPGHSLGRKIKEAQHPHDVLRGLYVRTTKHELGLPPADREFILVPMSPPQMALYSIIKQEVIKRLTGIKINSNIDLVSAKKSVMRLLQVSSNPIIVVRRLTEEQPQRYRYDDPKIEIIFKSIVEDLDSPKIHKACEIARSLSSQGEKCVIWTSFTENVERIASLLEDLGATYIHGGVNTGDETDPSTREGRIRQFHEVDGPCRVLVANPAACSEGISLHKVCHHAIYVDRTFNAAHYLQSVDRIHRLGLLPGTRTCIHILESIAPSIVGCIDFSVRRRLITKLRTMADVLEDFDLRRLALDEEESDAPVDYDISYEDLADIIDELVGTAPAPGEDEVW